MSRICTTILLLSILTFPLSAVGARWFDQDWQCRRVVRIVRADEPDSDVAIVDLYTGGLSQEDGSDFRVTDEENNLLPYYIVFHERARMSMLAFQAKDRNARYYVYYNNPNAEKMEDKWHPECGMFLLTRRKSRPNFHPQNWLEMEGLIADSVELDGGRFQRRISNGYNPFGLSDGYLSIYKGYINIPEAGKYGFATVSDEASFLFIDGKLVVSWPGQHTHGGGERGEHHGEIELKSGLHDIEYYHEDGTGEQMAYVAWKRPQDDRYKPIPKKAYPGALRAKAGRCQKRGQKLVADFIPQKVNSIWVEDWVQYTLIRFQHLSKNGSEDVNSVRWDFGDGVTSSEWSQSHSEEALSRSAPQHVYLSVGKYPVKLTVADDAGNTDTMQITINVHYDDAKRAAVGNIKEYYELVKNYPLEDLNMEDLWQMGQFHYRQRGYAEAIKVGRLFFEKYGTSAQNRGYQAYLMTADLLMKDRNFAVAIEIYKQIDETYNVPAWRLTAGMRIGDIYLIEGKYDDALKQYQSLLQSFNKKRGTKKLIKILYLHLGDAYRCKRDFEAARQAYYEMDKLKTQQPDFDKELELVKTGSLIETVEYYLSEDETESALKIIDRLEWKFPQEKMTGYSSFLRGKAHFIAGNNWDAIDSFKDSMAVEKNELHLQEAQWLIALCYDKLKKRDDAINAFRQLITQYSDNPLSYKAAEKLKEYGVIK